jgi:hypothetical protein
VARNAFRVALQTDTPLPTVNPRANATQELDPSDILEVQDMAEAIARAEQMVAATRTGRPSESALTDMFESLGRSAQRPARAPVRSAPRAAPAPAPGPTLAPAYARATDDAIGPATPAPPSIATPVPPRYVTMPSAPPAVMSPAAAVDDDAYYHPAGRIRSFADVTLDGYRPEPTLLVRAAGRRKRFSWVFVAALLPLLVLAAIAVFASAEASTAPASSAARTASASAPSVPAADKTRLATSSAASKDTSSSTVAAAAAAVTGPSSGAASAGATSATSGGASAATPVFDVNSLPAARTNR